MDKLNFREKLSTFSEHWKPKVIAEMNDYQFKLVKIRGDFVWHEHKGVRHRPSSELESHVMLVEPRGVVNTGDSMSELTAPNDEWV